MAAECLSILYTQNGLNQNDLIFIGDIVDKLTKVPVGWMTNDDVKTYNTYCDALEGYANEPKGNIADSMIQKNKFESFYKKSILIYALLFNKLSSQKITQAQKGKALADSLLNCFKKYHENHRLVEKTVAFDIWMSESIDNDARVNAIKTLFSNFQNASRNLYIMASDKAKQLDEKIKEHHATKENYEKEGKKSLTVQSDSFKTEKETLVQESLRLKNEIADLRLNIQSAQYNNEKLIVENNRHKNKEEAITHAECLAQSLRSRLTRFCEIHIPQRWRTFLNNFENAPDQLFDLILDAITRKSNVVQLSDDEMAQIYQDYIDSILLGLPQKTTEDKQSKHFDDRDNSDSGAGCSSSSSQSASSTSSAPPCSSSSSSSDSSRPSYYSSSSSVRTTRSNAAHSRHGLFSNVPSAAANTAAKSTQTQPSVKRESEEKMPSAKRARIGGDEN